MECNKQKFLKLIKEKTNEFNKWHQEMVFLVQEFKSDKNNNYIIDTDYELRDLEQLCFTYAWIIDQLNNRDGFVGGKDYQKSMSKKIRKALGYIL